MLMTSMAIMDLNVRRQSLLSRVLAFIRHRKSEPAVAIRWDHLSAPIPEASHLAPFVSEPDGSDLTVDYRWRRHPQLLQDASVTGLSAEERLARKQALRGLYFAHNGEFDAAGDAFRKAVDACDIDLTELPKFWQMPRGGILAAAQALESAGRFRAASTIQARLRSEFRPRSVVAVRPPTRIATSIRSAVAD